MLHSWPCSGLCLLFDFEQNPLTSLNFHFASCVPVLSVLPDLTTAAVRIMGEAVFRASQPFWTSVKPIHWWTLRANLLTQASSRSEVFRVPGPCLWLFPGVFWVLALRWWCHPHDSAEGSVLVCSGCHNQIPQTGGLKPQKWIFSPFWRPESKVRVSAGLVSSWGLSPWLSSHCLLTWSSLDLCPNLFFF